MRRMRVLAAGGAALAAVTAAALPAGAVDDTEADLAYHGAVSMAAGRVFVRFTPRNHGPSDVPDATVRLRWSAPLADGQLLPQGCARSGPRVLLCRVGPLASGEVGAQVTVQVRLEGKPAEVRLEMDTVWAGGVVDRNRENDEQRVLVLDTGDEYYF
ncbi:hypothetical protein [Streptomyces sp. NPDC047043]|uniref:hypothetical protein n=1 Tax=Streptomyces sp. NPDC047043 TaxID=3154497 RepID=UPI0033D97B0C